MSRIACSQSLAVATVAEAAKTASTASAEESRMHCSASRSKLAHLSQ